MAAVVAARRAGGAYGDALAAALEGAARARRILLAECARPGGPRGGRGLCPADEEAEREIRAVLEARFPGWGYLGEETGQRPAADGESHFWVVDPNDGTDAMLGGYRGHAVSIALLRGGLPVLGVVHAVNAPDDDGDLVAWAEGRPLTRNGRPVRGQVRPPALQPADVVLVPKSADWHPAGNLACTLPARFRAVPSIAYRLALVAAGEAAATLSVHGPGAVDYAGGHALLRGAGMALLDERLEPVAYAGHGASRVRHCFGGPEPVARQLAVRDWGRAAGSGFGAAAVPRELEPARPRPGFLCHDGGALRRAHGCLLGQVAGDSLGGRVEFRTAEQITEGCRGGPRELVDGGRWELLGGQPTDDSELALLLARSIVSSGGFEAEAAALAYVRWYRGALGKAAPAPWQAPFDVGTATARALAAVTPDDENRAAAAAAARRHADRRSQANGALVRVSPLGIWGWRRDPALVAEVARQEASLTHPHPVCREASALLAVTIAHAVRESTTPAGCLAWATSWAEQHCREPSVVAALRAAEHGPPADYRSRPGWVLVALQNAFNRLVAAPSLEEAVVQTVRCGYDTDTNAAVCGALAGAVYGRDAVPEQWRRMVLSCRAMPGLPGVRRPRPACLWPADGLRLAEALLLV